MRHQLHTQHLSGKIAGLINRLSNLDATAFAAASSVDLRFDHHTARTRVEQFFGDRFSLVARGGHRSAGYSHTILLKNRLCLILMNFHNDDSSVNKSEGPCLQRGTAGSKPLIL